MEALHFWADHIRQRRRCQLCFSISKDGKGGDHLGRPAAIHFWGLTIEQVIQVCEWELRENAHFEIITPTGTVLVLEQTRGLPIGGHLSAAMVKLVALKQELVATWPPLLDGAISARYRDNFFIIVRDDWTEQRKLDCAQSLSKLLMMPVIFERGGRQARCLEVRLQWDRGEKVEVQLA